MTIDHNRRSIRLQGFDYRNGGRYFVTICTKDKRCIFGEIRNGIMGLSDMGCVMADELQKTPIIRPYVFLDHWIIMPNHVHVIFGMHDHSKMQGDSVGAPWYGALDGAIDRATQRVAPTDNEMHIGKRKLLTGSLGSIIGQLKSACTKRIRAIDPTFAWQRNYFERIIRDEDEYARIYGYILRNPQNWEKDDLYL